jgi:hypothetical protein
MPRKKTVSRGLIVVFIILVLVVLAYVGLNMYKKQLDTQVEDLKAQTQQQRIALNTALSDETADFVVRSAALDKELYRGYDSNDVLGEIERIMILKESDNSGHRTVLKSFQYNSGSKTKKVFDDGEATLTGSGSVTITADADTFDVMAQQIDAFKNSEFFDEVQVGTTDRDDSGRIIFTLTMDVVGNSTSPYESDNISSTESVTEDVELNTEDTIEDVDIITNTETDSIEDTPVEDIDNNM